MRKRQLRGASLFDIHCHYFNGAYAFKELVAIGWNAMWGNYPHRSTRVTRFSTRRLSVLENWADAVQYVARLVGMGTRSCSEHWEYEQNACQEAFGFGTTLRTAPLMMDIYYMFDNGEDESWRSVRRRSMPARYREALDATLVLPQHAEQFQEYALDVKKQVIAQINRQKKKRGRRQSVATGELAQIDHMLRVAIDDLSAEPEGASLRRSALRNVRGAELSRGYAGHMDALVKLRENHPSTVFPFLAVDPRRLGILGLATDLLRARLFVGVKIYPPLGYLPSHPALDPVFTLCENEGVPVTVHCSPGGFPNRRSKVRVHSTDPSERQWWEEGQPESSPGAYFADPEKWRYVFKSHKKVKVNFAHFGGNESVFQYAESIRRSMPLAPAANWTANIIDLMESRENVYADLAYCPGPDTVDAVNVIVHRHPVVADRLMFGTDYIMIMLEKPENLRGLDDYLQRFQALPRQMFSVNPRAFLGP